MASLVVSAFVFIRAGNKKTAAPGGRLPFVWKAGRTDL